MAVMHIVGNRPQFIKLAPISRELRKRNIEEKIVHTGQHYDSNLSSIFFEELEIPYPTKNLKVGSGSHAQITAAAMIEIEKVLIENKPSVVIVYGDTNSTLAAVLVAAKLEIPIIHVEAGPRTYNMNNPEEINRVVADHLSSALCTPDKSSVSNLEKEGIDSSKIHFTGDVMYDEFMYCVAQEQKDFLKEYPSEYVLMTWHRQENTQTRERMEQILEFIEQIKYPIVLPLHPRTQKMLDSFCLMERIKAIPELYIIDPVGYKEMTTLLNHCKILLSDSGGASKEASFVRKKCVFMLPSIVWPDLVKVGYIYPMDIESENGFQQGLDRIKSAFENNEVGEEVSFFGDGNAAKKIVDIIEKMI